MVLQQINLDTDQPMLKTPCHSQGMVKEPQYTPHTKANKKLTLQHALWSAVTLFSWSFVLKLISLLSF